MPLRTIDALSDDMPGSRPLDVRRPSAVIRSSETASARVGASSRVRGAGARRSRPPRAGAPTSRRRGRPARSARHACRCSAIAPSSSTMIWSALTTVESRCAMTSAVRFCDTSSSADWISRSVAVSSAEVASSRIEDRRPLQDRAGDGDALLLAARKLQPALADLRVVAVRQALDEVGDLRHPRRLAHLGVGGVPASVADVVADRVVEEHGVLRDDADRGAKALLRHVADVLPVDQDAPAGHVVEAEEQPRDRRLARARRADDRDLGVLPGPRS